MAAPSAAASEYMFAPNWSAKGEYHVLRFRQTPASSTPAALAPFGNFRNDDHTVKVGVNYRFNFGEPGGRALLIAFQCGLRKGRRYAGLFAFWRPISGSRKIGQNKRSAARNTRKASHFPNLLTGYRDTAAARKHHKVA